MNTIRTTYRIFCKSYQDGKAVRTERIIVQPGVPADGDFLDGRCRVSLIWSGEGGSLRVSFPEDSKVPVSVGLEVIVSGWKRENYVFMPGAVYNGNRFVSKRIPYPPYYQETDTDPMQADSVITDIHHLDTKALQSRISLLSGDMTTPAAGFYRTQEKDGFLIFGKHVPAGEGAPAPGFGPAAGRHLAVTDDMTENGYTGFVAEEDLGEQTLTLQYCFPGVREGRKYFFGEKADGSGWYPDGHARSEEEGSCFAAGDGWELPFVIRRTEAEGMDEFFACFNRSKQCLEQGDLSAHSVPFSAAYEAIKAKYQRENFIEEKSGGYYAVGVRRDVPPQCWQAGWIGGGMNNLPFLLEEKEEGEAFGRALATFRFILDELQEENGWVTGLYANGRSYGDAFEEKGEGTVLLVRKNGDLLYFLCKQCLYLGKKKLLRPGDAQKVQKLADAFVRLYEKYGQLGQFIDTRADKMLIAHTSGASSAVAGLALSWELWRKEAYLDTAAGLGDFYAEEYLAKGILNGCPGEICQAPDSEAAFGLLEAYVQMYETTGEQKWLVFARQTAELAMTWVMSYDFCFPVQSTAAKMGDHTIGTVFANAQNKHSAPGICTFSGNSLLKLYRFTGEEKYLDWLQSIAHSLPQFVSLPERPEMTLDKMTLPFGYMNERVQTSDWEGKHTVGEFLNGSNWPEVSMLLTYVEVPGIYVDLEKRLVKVMDHVNCTGCVWKKDSVSLTLENPTIFPARVTALAEGGNERTGMTHNYFERMQTVCLAPGERRMVSIC